MLSVRRYINIGSLASSFQTSGNRLTIQYAVGGAGRPTAALFVGALMTQAICQRSPGEVSCGGDGLCAY